MSFTLTAVEARSVTLRQYAAQSNVAYRFVRGIPNDTVIIVSAQDPTPSDMRLLDDGVSTRDVRVFIADDEIRQGDTTNGIPCDEVIDNGVTYQIQRSQKADALGPIPDSWRAIGVRLQPLQAPEGA